MQTQLRIARLIAASLLFTRLLSAATPPATTAQPQQHHCPRATGLASWYGAAHEGLTMANGQPFDPSKFTAASDLLPLGAKIRVFNAASGKSVVVTITDRGPARRLNRILDLSQAAAERLGYTKRGLALVYYSPV